MAGEDKHQEGTDAPTAADVQMGKDAPGGPELHAGTEVPHDAGHAKVFPPLDPQFVAPQLFWLAVTFVALYVVLSRFTLPRIGEVIEERADRVKRDLEAAERLQGETQKALEAYEKSLADARGNATSIARETREKLSAETEAERTKVEATLAAKLGDAEKAIAQTKDKALASVTQIAAETAGDVVRQLTGKDVTADEVKRALQPAAGE